MRKIVKKTIEVETLYCDICGLEGGIQQYTPDGKKVAYIMHQKCLIEHLEKTFVPEYKRA